MASSVPDYLEWMRQRGFSEETIIGRRRFFRRLEQQLGVMVDDATLEMLASWRAGLTITDRSVERYISHLRAFYVWQLDEHRRGDNPARTLPVPRTGRLLPRPIADEDLAAALLDAPRRIRIWLVLAAWGGLRAKEIALLRRESILETAPRPVLLVTAAATKGRNERAVPLSDFVVSELRAAGLPSWGYAFPRGDGQPGHNKPSRVSQLCGDYFRSIGIRASLHQLRHWYGTGCWRNSHDLRLVQELMGHQTPITTAGYAAWDRLEAAAVVNRLPLPKDLPSAGLWVKGFPSPVTAT